MSHELRFERVFDAAPEEVFDESVANATRVSAEVVAVVVMLSSSDAPE